MLLWLGSSLAHIMFSCQEVKVRALVLLVSPPFSSPSFVSCPGNHSYNIAPPPAPSLALCRPPESSLRGVLSFHRGRTAVVRVVRLPYSVRSRHFSVREELTGIYIDSRSI